jgi:hypothetical protein
MAQLHKQLEEARNATESTRDHVKAGTKKTYDGLKDGFQQARQWVSDRIAPWATVALVEIIPGRMSWEMPGLVELTRRVGKKRKKHPAVTSGKSLPESCIRQSCNSNPISLRLR